VASTSKISAEKRRTDAPNIKSDDKSTERSKDTDSDISISTVIATFEATKGNDKIEQCDCLS
jgi:hypothetical protein